MRFRVLHDKDWAFLLPKGIKHHVIVDKNGFLIAVMVTIANVHDSKAAYLLMRVLKEMCSGVKVILADGGYRGELMDNIRKNFGYVIQVVISAFKEQGFRPIQKKMDCGKVILMDGLQ